MRFIKELIKLYRYYKSPRVVILFGSDVIYLRLLAKEKDTDYDYFFTSFSSLFLFSDITNIIKIHTTKEYMNILTENQLKYIKDNYIIRYLA